MKRFLFFSNVVVFIVVTSSAQWTRQVTGMTNQSVGALYADTATLYVGTTTSVFKSTNLGVNWSSSSGGLPATTNFYSIVRSGNFLIAGGDGAGIWRSSNNGASWVQTTSGVPANQYTLAFYVEGNTVYAAFGFTSAVGISTDNGATWTKYTNGLTTTQTMTGVAKIGTRLFATHQTLGAYISTDNGVNWALTSGVISSQNKNALIASATSLVVGVSGPSTQNGIFRSTNLGTTWTKVRTGPLVTGLAKNGSTVYSVGDSIHRSTNDGLTWIPVDGTGLGVSVWNTMQFASTFAFVNHFGLGVYRRPISELSAVEEKLSGELPSGFRLEQNYPNPFNPSTTIQFTIPVGTYGHTSLRVYDVLGREVRTLVNEELKPGSYETTFDASGFASGVYFYRLQAGSFSDVKTLVLIK